MAAATSTFLLAALSGAQAVSSLSGASSQASAIKAQGRYQEGIFKTNARLANLQAEDAIRRGDEDANTVRGSARRLRGTQRAGYAGQGVSVDAGTPADVQRDTGVMGELDAITVKNNAWREAWGYKIQAADYTARGEFARISSRSDARNTIATGGLNALGSVVQGVGLANRYGAPSAKSGPKVPRARRGAQGWREDY